MLQDLMRSKPTEVETEYMPGFFVHFRYVSSADVERILHAQKMTLKGGKLDTASFTDGMRLAISRGITGWHGLTKEVLLKMDLDLDLEKLEKADFKELPYADEIKSLLLKADVQFFEWCQSICTEIITMRELSMRQAEKNLQTL